MVYRNFEEIEKPEFPNIAYDFRNKSAGAYCGVGEAGKVGKMGSSSDSNPMPKDKKITKVPREYGED